MARRQNDIRAALPVQSTQLRPQLDQVQIPNDPRKHTCEQLYSALCAPKQEIIPERRKETIKLMLQCQEVLVVDELSQPLKSSLMRQYR